jgi:hypothetical protein
MKNNGNKKPHEIARNLGLDIMVVNYCLFGPPCLGKGLTVYNKETCYLWSMPEKDAWELERRVKAYQEKTILTVVEI